MDITGLIIFLAIGGVAGWLAGAIMKVGFSLVGTILVGVIGALIGGFVLPMVGVQVGGLIGQIISATVGAVILLFVLKFLKK